MTNKLLLSGAAFMVMLLAACRGKDAPDEFLVLRNPALVVPPEYHLRPPGDDTEVSGTYTPEQLARQALFGR